MPLWIPGAKAGVSVASIPVLPRFPPVGAVDFRFFELPGFLLIAGDHLTDVKITNEEILNSHDSIQIDDFFVLDPTDGGPPENDAAKAGQNGDVLPKAEADEEAARQHQTNEVGLHSSSPPPCCTVRLNIRSCSAAFFASLRYHGNTQPSIGSHRASKYWWSIVPAARRRVKCVNFIIMGPWVFYSFVCRALPASSFGKALVRYG